MSAVLTAEDIQPVADLLEKVQNVQRAIRDLQDAQGDDPKTEFSCAITIKPLYEKEAAVANTHGLSFWVVLQGLAAMERELLQKLDARNITVESVLS